MRFLLKNTTNLHVIHDFRQNSNLKPIYLRYYFRNIFNIARQYINRVR